MKEKLKALKTKIAANLPNIIIGALSIVTVSAAGAYYLVRLNQPPESESPATKDAVGVHVGGLVYVDENGDFVRMEILPEDS